MILVEIRHYSNPKRTTGLVIKRDNVLMETYVLKKNGEWEKQPQNGGVLTIHDDWWLPTTNLIVENGAVTEIFEAEKK